MERRTIVNSNCETNTEILYYITNFVLLKISSLLRNGKISLLQKFQCRTVHEKELIWFTTHSLLVLVSLERNICSRQQNKWLVQFKFWICCIMISRIFCPQKCPCPLASVHKFDDSIFLFNLNFQAFGNKTQLSVLNTVSTQLSTTVKI